MLLATKWWTFLLLAILCSTSASLAQTRTNSSITIIVDGSGGNTTCHNKQQKQQQQNGLGEVVCVTNSFNMALKEIQDSSFSSILMQVNPGNYTLKYGPENNITCHRESGHSTLTITGTNKAEHTVLNCEPLAGIFLHGCFNVTLELMTLNHCGFNHFLPLFLYSYNTNYPNLYSLQPAAVVIHRTHYVSLANVTILNSQGSGLLLHSNEAIISDCIVTGGRGIMATEDSISGGIVLHNFYSEEFPALSRVSITQSQITNNNYATPIIEGIAYGGAALTVLELPTVLEVESSVITNNSRGLFMYNHKSLTSEGDILQLSNVAMFHSWSDNGIVLDKSKIKLNLFYIAINEIITVDQKYFDQDFYPTDSLNVSIQCGTNSNCSIPLIQFKHKYVSSAQNAKNHSTPLHGICSNNGSTRDFTDGKCPIPYSVKEYVNIEASKEYGKNDFQFTEINYACWGNRTGDLCGQCIEGHSVAINSPYLSCVPCDGLDVAIGWIMLIVLEFIPVTVMVAVIALLNVNLNQGSLNAYVFFCQILTIPFPSVSYPAWYVFAYNFKYRSLDFLLYPFSAVWNLGFIIYPSCNFFSDDYDNSYSCHWAGSICLSYSSSALLPITIWYLIAFYPFLLLFLVYHCVVAYNKGYRSVVRIIRPIHRLLARFWRMFDIQPSLPATIASVYTLCFTQIAATSLKLLHGTQLKGKPVFFYDGSQEYFNTWQHILAVILAVIVLIVFIILPVVYLSVYPFKWFQSCLNRVKIRKDLLISVTDVFTAPYSNGTTADRKWDYRCFAGMHFIFHLMAMFGYSFVSNPINSIFFLASQCIFFLILLVIFRPYKRLLHVFTNTMIVLTLYSLLILAMALQFLVFSESFDIYLAKYMPGIGIIYMYTLIALCYCIYWMFRKCKTAYYRQGGYSTKSSTRSSTHRKRSESIASTQMLVKQHYNDEFDADRVVNPTEYEQWKETCDISNNLPVLACN